jgi:hypothetical protein
MDFCGLLTRVLGLQKWMATKAGSGLMFRLAIIQFRYNEASLINGILR